MYDDLFFVNERNEMKGKENIFYVLFVLLINLYGVFKQFRFIVISVYNLTAKNQIKEKYTSIFTSLLVSKRLILYQTNRTEAKKKKKKILSRLRLIKNL